MWSISQVLEEHFSNFLGCRGILEDFDVFGKFGGF